MNKEETPIANSFIDAGQKIDDEFVASLDGDHQLGEVIAKIVEFERANIENVALAIGRVESMVKKMARLTGVDIESFEDVTYKKSSNK